MEVRPGGGDLEERGGWDEKLAAGMRQSARRGGDGDDMDGKRRLMVETAGRTQRP